MEEFEYLLLSLDKRGVATVTLNRPEVHNAFNDKVIDELSNLFGILERDPEVRIIVLKGAGASFSAGADISWMKSYGEATEAQNFEASLVMGGLFQRIADCNKLTLAVVQGAALGGGSGLVSAVDIALAGPDALFGFTEVRLGIVAAVISPFVINKLGSSEAKAKFLTGERFGPEEAHRIGLIYNWSEDLEELLEKTLQSLLKGGPKAQEATKLLVEEVQKAPWSDKVEVASRYIAKARISQEGQAGLTAFLENKPAPWVG